MNTVNKSKISWPVWLAALVMGLAAVVPAQSQSRYAYSADGAEVTDAQTGLIWRRCTEGQTWMNSTCTGGLTVFGHERALAHAMTQSGWRLPNVKELTSLVDTGSVRPAINAAAFPGTPTAVYWSSTPDVQLPTSAWSVDFALGTVATVGRNTLGVLVRLVR